MFNPFYGYMIANYISEVWNRNHYPKFNIVEIGPGTGALAESVIQYLNSNMFQRKVNFDYH